MVTLILDNKILIISFVVLLSSYKLYSYLGLNKKSIPPVSIVISLENEHIYQAIITITSLMENSKNTTKYNAFLLIPNNFLLINRQKLRTLEVKYPKLELSLIYVENEFINLIPRKKETPISLYYKLFLPSLLSNEIIVKKIEKVIFLGWDTLIYKDLTKLFNVDMKNFYFMGFENKNKNIESSLLLINIKKVKESNSEENDIKNFIKKNKKEIINLNDEIILNKVYKPQEKIGVFEPIYGIHNFESVDECKKYWKENHEEKENNIMKENKNVFRNKKGDFIDINEFILAYSNPAVLRLECKPWKRNIKCYKEEDWWDLARSSIFYDEIEEIFIKEKK